MKIDDRIIEEIRRHNSINNYILEQEAGELPPPPTGEVPAPDLGAPPVGEAPAPEGAVPPAPELKHHNLLMLQQILTLKKLVKKKRIKRNLK